MNEKEPIKIPVRTELTVLSVDDPHARTIGFSIFEQVGSEIWRPPERATWPPESYEDCISIAVDANWVFEEDLEEGAEFLVRGLIGFSVLVVHKDSYGGVFGMSSSQKMGFSLSFEKDRLEFRKGKEPSVGPPRWVCVCTSNLEGLRKLEISK